MTVWSRLQAEAAANRPKAIVLGVLLVGFGVSLLRPWLFAGAQSVADAAVLLLGTPTPADSKQPYWMSIDAESTSLAARPLEVDQTPADPFAIDEGQFPPPLLFAADPVARKRHPLPVTEEEEPDPLAPDLLVTATLSGRMAVIDGRMIRIDRPIFAGDERFDLIEVGAGWVVVQAADGSQFRLSVRRGYRTARR